MEHWVKKPDEVERQQAQDAVTFAAVLRAHKDISGETTTKQGNREKKKKTKKGTKSTTPAVSGRKRPTTRSRDGSGTREKSAKRGRRSGK